MHLYPSALPGPFAPQLLAHPRRHRPPPPPGARPHHGPVPGHHGGGHARQQGEGAQPEAEVRQHRGTVRGRGGADARLHQVWGGGGMITHSQHGGPGFPCFSATGCCPACPRPCCPLAVLPPPNSTPRSGGQSEWSDGFSAVRSLKYGTNATYSDLYHKLITITPVPRDQVGLLSGRGGRCCFGACFGGLLPGCNLSLHPPPRPPPLHAPAPRRSRRASASSCSSAVASRRRRQRSAQQTASARTEAGGSGGGGGRVAAGRVACEGPATPEFLPSRDVGGSLQPCHPAWTLLVHAAAHM